METRYVITHNGVYKCEFENPADFNAFDWERFTMDFAKTATYAEAANWLAQTAEEFIAEGKRFSKMGKDWEDDAYFHTAQGTAWKKMVFWMAGHRWCNGRVYEKGGFRIYPMFGNELGGLVDDGWSYAKDGNCSVPDSWEKDGYIDPSDDSFTPAVVEE